MHRDCGQSRNLIMRTQWDRSSSHNKFPIIESAIDTQDPESKLRESATSRWIFVSITPHISKSHTTRITLFFRAFQGFSMTMCCVLLVAAALVQEILWNVFESEASQAGGWAGEQVNRWAGEGQDCGEGKGRTGCGGLPGHDSRTKNDRLHCRVFH
jgi:hypothetical protein